MISFIIIGKNIENTINLCVNSVYNYIKKNQLKKYEVIYVDSDSSDKTLLLALGYNISIYTIKGEVNSAIARNIGAKKANGDIYFFIDGDMEILPNSYSFIFNKNTQQLNYPFNNGFWQDKFYDENFNFLNTQLVNLPKSPEFTCTTGGLIVIEKSLWNMVNGMDERLIRSQDHDLGFRLSKINFPAKRYNKLIAIHHTISYFNKKRFKQFVFSKVLFSQGILMRKHIFDKNYLRRYSQVVSFVVLLIVLSILVVTNTKIGISMFILYILLHFIRVLKNYHKEKIILFSLLYKMFHPLITLFSLLCYFPRNPKYSVEKLNG